MPRCNKSRFALLGLLNKRPMSGYDIKTIFGRFSKFHWSESNAQIYPMLKALEKDGYVSSSIDPQSGARLRRLYTITKAGQGSLNEWLEQPVEFSTSRDELLLKMSCSEHLPDAVLISHLHEYKLDIIERQKTLVKQFEHLENDHAGRPDQSNLLLAYGQSQYVLEAKLKWCEMALSSFKKQA
jgi:PadR family transcriptional regulator, regulatory protein AphA